MMTWLAFPAKKEKKRMPSLRPTLPERGKSSYIRRMTRTFSADKVLEPVADSMRRERLSLSGVRMA
jgi:hypothetical protein